MQLQVLCPQSTFSPNGLGFSFCEQSAIFPIQLRSRRNLHKCIKKNSKNFKNSEFETNNFIQFSEKLLKLINILLPLKFL